MQDVIVEDGPWKGWKLWHARDEGRFTDSLGVVYFRDGAFEGGEGVVAAMDTSRRHANGMGALHGGFLMAFVDIAMFAAVRHKMTGMSAVTLQASTDFLGAGEIGKPLEGRGRIVKETGKLIWVSGTLTQEDGARLVGQWHGLLRKVPRTRP